MADTIITTLGTLTGPGSSHPVRSASGGSHTIALRLTGTGALVFAGALEGANDPAGPWSSVATLNASGNDSVAASSNSTTDYAFWRATATTLTGTGVQAVVRVSSDPVVGLGGSSHSTSGAAVGTLPQGIHEPWLEEMSPRRTDISGITLTWGPTSLPAANAEYSALGTPYVDFSTQVLTTANARYVQPRHSTGLRWAFHSASLDSGINGSTIQNTQGGGGIEIIVPGSSVTFGFVSNAVGKARIKINGRYLQSADTEGYVSDPAAVAVTGNAPQFVTINFPYASNWRVFFGASNIRGIFVQANKYVAPAEPMPIGLGFGDSFASRILSTGDPAEFGQLNQLVGLSMGIDMLPLGKGGTGFNNAGTMYKYVDGLNWLAANKPDLDPAYVWGFGSGNDQGANLAGLQASCEAFISSALTNYGSRSLRNVIITGAYNGFTTDTAIVDGVNTRLKAAIAAINDPRVYYVPVDATDGDSTPIFTGTGSVADRKGDGNADFYLSTPQQGAGDRHPNRAGVLHAAESYAWQIWQAIAYGRRDWT